MKNPTKYPDKIITKYLEFIHDFQDVYKIFNKSEENIGYLKYERVGRHTQWCLYQYTFMRISSDCLKDILDIQKKLIDIRRKQDDN